MSPIKEVSVADKASLYEAAWLGAEARSLLQQYQAHLARLREVLRRIELGCGATGFAEQMTAGEPGVSFDPDAGRLSYRQSEPGVGMQASKVDVQDWGSGSTTAS